MNPRLKRLFYFYLISAVGVVLLFSAGLMIKAYSASLIDTYDTLQTLKVKHVVMKNTIRDIDSTIIKIKKEIPGDLTEEMVIAEILYTVDTFKVSFSTYVISIQAIEKKDLNIILPVTIRGPIFNYEKFINDIAYIQNLRHPFFVISDLSIEKREQDAKSIVIFEIKGYLTMQVSPPVLTSGS